MLNRLKKIFESFQKNEVKYVVIGGIAAVLHGVPRTTFDLDILIEKSQENAERLLNAFMEAGLATALMTTQKDILENEITVFKDFVRIDVQTSTPGISFQDCWKHKISMDYQGQTFFVIARDDLIASKRASGRPIDFEDIRLLELTDNPNN